MIRDAITVLDHGYVRHIETWGSDQSIVESARMSTGKGFKGWGGSCNVCETQCAKCGGSGEIPDVGFGAQRCPDCPCKECGGTGRIPGDEKFLAFLYTNKHMSPFEQAGMTIEVQAPIFVLREWHRHRTQSYNEMSGRYSVLPDLYYLPSVERLMEGKQNHKNKQGSEAGMPQADAERFRRWLIEHYETARGRYTELLQQNVAREIARLVLPVAQYSRMRASANLRNWLQFLTLRLAPSAQWEIRQYAHVVASLLADAFPRTFHLFVEEVAAARKA